MGSPVASDDHPVEPSASHHWFEDGKGLMFRWRMWWVAYIGFFLNGVGTVLLGPMLPRLESLWHLRDGQSGALIAAQFLGMSAGTILVAGERRRAMALGAVCSCAGLSGLGLLLLFADESARTALLVTIACAMLAAHGFGLGQVITALNLHAGAESGSRQARLSLGNAMWSFGAIGGPLIMVLALAGTALAWWLIALGLVFVVIWISNPGNGDDAVTIAVTPADQGMTSRIVMVFGALMVLYGGAESCLAGWVTTFARRVSSSGSAISPLSASAFWFGVAAGRALAAAFLKDWRERPAMFLLIGGSAVGSFGLVFAGTLDAVTLWAAVTGLLLGPAFAVIIAETLNEGASSRQAGMVLAMCGLGASVMPLLLGVISQRVHSLRLALLLPGVCLAGMLALVALFVRTREDLLEENVGPERARLGPR